MTNQAEPRTEFDARRFVCPPCYLCGYIGHGYYQPSIHACASWYPTPNDTVASLREELVALAQTNNKLEQSNDYIRANLADWALSFQRFLQESTVHMSPVQLHQEATRRLNSLYESWSDYEISCNRFLRRAACAVKSAEQRQAELVRELAKVKATLASIATTGVTEDILRAHDGFIKIGRGCVVVQEKEYLAMRGEQEGKPS